MTINFRGAWDAFTNYPYLQNGAGIVGDVYTISNDGYQNLGSGSVLYRANDSVQYQNDNTWHNIPLANINYDTCCDGGGGNSGSVTSVAIAGSQFVITGSPVTSSGTITITIANVANPSWLTSIPWSKITATPETLSGYGITDAVNVSTLGAINGVATLDSSGTLEVSQLPASVVGAVVYKGTWNALTNTPTLASSTGTNGFYYIVDVAGTTTLDGISVWALKDIAIFNGTVWNKISGAGNDVLSVFGRTGAVVAVPGDYNYADVGAVPIGRNITINGITHGLSADQTWNVTYATLTDVTLTSIANGQLTKYDSGTSKWINFTPSYLTSVAFTDLTSHPTTLSGYGITDSISSTRSLTINGVTYDLSANRTWTVGDVLIAGSYANPSWITALSYSKIVGGTSAQFVKADGSLDSSTYITSLTAVPYTGATTDLAMGTHYITAARAGIGASASLNFFLTMGGAIGFDTGLGSTFKHLRGPFDAALNIGASVPNSTTTAVPGNDVNIIASNAVAGSSTPGAAAGGSGSVTTGNAARLTSGNANGGDYSIITGTGIGAGHAGEFYYKPANVTRFGVAYDGTVGFYGLTSGVFAIKASAVTTDYIITMPATQGTGAFVNDGSGNMSWSSLTTTYAALTDVNLTSLTNGQLTKYDSGTSKWVNFTPTYITSAAFSTLTDVNFTSLADGQFVKYDAGSSKWINFTPSLTTTYAALTDVNLTSLSNGQLTKYDSGTSKWINFTPTYITLASLSNTAPITYNSSTGAIGITQSDTSTNGYISSTDWNTFNNKVATTRTISTTAPLSGGGDLSTNRTLIITQSTTSTDGYLSSTDWNTFNGKQAALSGTGFVKITGTTISYDNSTYLTANQTITLSGDVSGSGTTTITVAIGASKVTNTMLAGSITASKLVGTDITTVGTVTSGVWNATRLTSSYIPTDVAYTDVQQTWTKSQASAIVDVTYAATINPDLSLANPYRTQLTGNVILGTPTNIVEGQSGVIYFYQDATGSRLLSSASWAWCFPAGLLPTLSTGAMKKDMLTYLVSQYKTATVTMGISNPGTVTWPSAHNLFDGMKVQFTGSVPGGVSASTTYWVVVTSSTTFKIAATFGSTTGIQFTGSPTTPVATVIAIDTNLVTDFR